MRYWVSSLFIPFSLSTALASPGFDYVKEDYAGYHPVEKLQVANDDPGPSFQRNGHATYVFASYLYDYRLLKNNTLTTTEGPSSTTYVPLTVFPSSYFSGFEVGLGHELNRYLDAQVSYQQIFKTSKNSTSGGSSFTGTYGQYGVLADLAFFFNPDSQYQFYAKVGASIYEAYSHIKKNTIDFYMDGYELTVNPAVGLGVLIQFNEHFGFRIDEIFTASLQDNNANGDLSTRVGLNYVF